MRQKKYIGYFLYGDKYLTREVVCNGVIQALILLLAEQIGSANKLSTLVEIHDDRGQSWTVGDLIKLDEILTKL